MAKKLTMKEKAYRLIARYPEAADMCRHDYSNMYIVKFANVSAGTVTALRRAIALTESHYSNHTNGFEYRW